MVNLPSHIRTKPMTLDELSAFIRGQNEIAMSNPRIRTAPAPTPEEALAAMRAAPPAPAPYQHRGIDLGMIPEDRLAAGAGNLEGPLFEPPVLPRNYSPAELPEYRRLREPTVIHDPSPIEAALGRRLTAAERAPLPPRAMSAGRPEVAGLDVGGDTFFMPEDVTKASVGLSQFPTLKPNLMPEFDPYEQVGVFQMDGQPLDQSGLYARRSSIAEASQPEAPESRVERLLTEYERTGNPRVLESLDRALKVVEGGGKGQVTERDRFLEGQKTDRQNKAMEERKSRLAQQAKAAQALMEQRVKELNLKIRGQAGQEASKYFEMLTAQSKAAMDLGEFEDAKALFDEGMDAIDQYSSEFGPGTRGDAPADDAVDEITDADIAERFGVPGATVQMIREIEAELGSDIDDEIIVRQLKARVRGGAKQNGR